MGPDFFSFCEISLSIAEDSITPKPVRSPVKEATFKKICDALNPFIHDDSINAFTVDVDQETMEVKLELTVPGIWE